ncbi:hypothetical protein UA08_05107 [Talaromyces atroroseus]|uniref:Uncharacterized protein n=1 Tax=Talaromyces atroroseus TaxID=1441469 RepID=A0A225AMF6_TALAT|nr:hypothetical protein UA08_05107 [Talaromyces atroroseus]OKL59514.1 hypothetical protein UA08_05107 [Talaromyces atroroseus]
MADDKAKVQQVDETTTPAVKRSFFARVGAHYRKWWWLHLIILVVVVLVITLPIVYVAYPRIAQSDVNKSSLNITNLVFSNPTPSSIHANQTQVLTNKASYHPTIYAFNASISLPGASAPLSTVLIPRLQANDGEIINVDATLALNQSTDAVANFTMAVLGLESFQLNFYGRPDLKEGALPREKVSFNKTVTMNGLNGLRGFSLEDLMIASDLTNLNGTALIPNPSIITVAMGNVTLDVSVNGTQIGQSYLTNLVLAPGNNSVPLQGTINTTQVLGLITGNTSAYSSGVLPLGIRGISSVYNGQEIPYFSQALQANLLQTPMNITQVLINSGLGDLATVL